MRKRIFRKFRYRNCDSMACCLEDMARKGWHFTGWDWGMRFERGTPSEVCYDVEVFPKGSEMDLRPSEEAEEYAEYCREAGWELIDGRKKFCVFRQVKEDAAAIVTPAERFQNVKSAEVREYLPRLFSQMFLTVLFWGQLLTRNFERWIFNDLMLFALVLYLFIFVGTVLEGAVLLFWIRQKRKILADGGEPFYGHMRKGQKNKYGRDIFEAGQSFVLLMILMAAVYQAIRTGEYTVLLFLAAALLVIGGGGILLSVLKPSRGENWLIQTGSVFLIPMVLVILSVSLIVIDENEEHVEYRKPDVPLVQMDYKDITGDISDIRKEHGQSFMGSADTSMVVYETSTGETDAIHYTVYTSKYDWVLNKLWGRQMETTAEAEDVTAQWEAVNAVISTTTVTTYTVRYPEKILIMWVTAAPLDTAQIETVCNKLALP